MDQSFKEQLAIPTSFEVKHVGSKWGQSKGQDADTDTYDVFDQAGVLVKKFEIVQSMSIYPPYPTTISFTEISPDGKRIRSGELQRAVK